MDTLKAEMRQSVVCFLDHTNPSWVEALMMMKMMILLLHDYDNDNDNYDNNNNSNNNRGIKHKSQFICRRPAV